MKFYYLAGLLFLGVVFGRNIGDDTNKVDDNSSEELFSLNANNTEKILAKCREVGGEVAAKKFNTGLQSTISCLNNQTPKSKEELKQEIGEEENPLCSKRRKALRGCFVDLIDAVKDCSVEQEKYAPEFFFDAFDTLLDFVCADNSKVLQNVFESNGTWVCVENLVNKALAGNLTYICTENFKLLHANDDNIITKPELCEDLNSAKTCYSAFLVNECPEAKELNLFVSGVFESIISPCKSFKVKRHLTHWAAL